MLAQLLFDPFELEGEPAQRLQVLEGRLGAWMEGVGLQAVEQCGLLRLAGAADGAERVVDGFSGLLDGGDDGVSSFSVQ